jgi:hypothetical protein
LRVASRWIFKSAKTKGALPDSTAALSVSFTTYRFGSLACAVYHRKCEYGPIIVIWRRNSPPLLARAGIVPTQFVSGVPPALGHYQGTLVASVLGGTASDLLRKHQLGCRQYSKSTHIKLNDRAAFLGYLTCERLWTL